MIVYPYNEEKSQRFIEEETGAFRKGVQGVPERWKGSGESECQPQSERKRKLSERTLLRLSLADQKLTPKELTRETKDSTGVKLSAPTVRKRLFKNALWGCKARKKPLLIEKQRKRRLEWAPSHV